MVAGLVLVGCSGSDTETADPIATSSTATSEVRTTVPPLVPEELLADAESFYDVPDPIPAGEHGDLIRYQLTGDQPDGLTRYRVMYLSETVQGDPTVITGLVSVPDGEGPEGGWPVLTYARGSSGIADDCAISMAIDGTRGADSNLAAEAWLVENAVIEHQMVATVTDYPGIGGPGIHPFLHGVGEARGALDIVRAAGDLPDVELRSDVGIMGYSQGGHAALWANQEAEAWTPELVIHGTVAGAPASEVDRLLEPGGLFNESSATLVAAGLAQEHPELELDDILTPAGLELVELTAGACRPDPDRSFALSGEKLLQVQLHESPAWWAEVEGNVPGHQAASSPVLIFHGDADANVPIGHSEDLLARLCASGVGTERRVLPGADHVAGAIPTIADGTEWLADLIAGTVEPPSC